MRLTWSASRQLRSFYDPATHRLTIVSDVIDDETEGRVYGERLAIAWSPAGGFRDLELLPGVIGSGGSAAEVVNPVLADGPVAVWVSDTSEPEIERVPGSAAVTIRLLPAMPERWVQLRGSGVLLGLVDEDVLAAIQVEPEVDPDGEREARWLDSVDV